MKVQDFQPNHLCLYCTLLYLWTVITWYDSLVLAVDMPCIIPLGPSLDGEALGQVCIQSDGDSFDYIKDNQQ